MYNGEGQLKQAKKQDVWQVLCISSSVLRGMKLSYAKPWIWTEGNNSCYYEPLVLFLFC